MSLHALLALHCCDIKCRMCRMSSMVEAGDSIQKFSFIYKHSSGTNSPLATCWYLLQAAWQYGSRFASHSFHWRCTKTDESRLVTNGFNRTSVLPTLRMPQILSSSSACAENSKNVKGRYANVRRKRIGEHFRILHSMSLIFIRNHEKLKNFCIALENWKFSSYEFSCMKFFVVSQ